MMAIAFLLAVAVKTDAQSAAQQLAPPPSATAPSVSARADAYGVSWDEPGPGSSASMPLGNGDIGLNVWVDPGGDLLFYISKTDAWGGEKDPAADPWMQQGGDLMKLGLVRVKLSSNPLASGGPFRQTLHPGKGEIDIAEGAGVSAVNYRVWVDANHPVIHVEIAGGRPADARVTLYDWRLDRGDTVVPAASGRTSLTWYHRNPGPGDDRLADPHLANITFGATIEGGGLLREDDTTMRSAAPSATRLISIHVLTATTSSAGAFLGRLATQRAETDHIDIHAAWSAHEQWWRRFWERSYIFLQGSSTADSVTRGYVLQRFVTACSGRGAYPVKFNGSIFVVDNPGWKINGQVRPMNADFRAWGGQYWFQNTRPMYWPCLMAGDFDLMMPFFKLYLHMLPGNSALVQKYYGHDGAYFQETSPFWGGLPFMGPGEQALYTHHYFTPVLELSMMMLDYYDYTGDAEFARTYLLPIASAGLEFFDRHFPRDSTGHLLLDPDNSIEMFWKVHDPAPDLAGLHAVLSRMLKLPPTLAPGTVKEKWRRLLSIVPPLPVDSTAGEGRLLPYTGPQTAKSHNEENPELYAIYPFRLYGLGKPGLELARHSFDIRKCPQEGCWSQDPIQAAMLGYTDAAAEDVRYALTRKDPGLKFPAFWAASHDYLPDEDNGGNGENGLQQMLLQVDGRKLLLLPAWPAGWDADFKLHAPYRTTIEGKVRKGRLTELVVTPAARRADVIDCTKSGACGVAAGGSAAAGGRTRHSARSRFPSYKGLLMAGYQGWFNAPGDSAGRGWNHYHAAGPFEPGNCKFDLWPDVSEYARTYPTPFTYADGSTAYLFSSYDSSTTDLHFRWMQQYGIDGVFMQRFVNSVKSDPSRHHTNVVLRHALDDSRKYGRAIAIMYDLSGMKDSVDVDVVINDWKYLVDSLRLTSGGDDQTYLYHHGKPLVAIWGAGFGDHRAYTARSVQNQIPRDSGRFFWEQVAGDLHAGARMLYVAMFDEIDEGTAIFKASLHPPEGKSSFVTFDPGIPSDYYLQLAGYAAKMLRQRVPFREDPPPPLTN